MTNYENEVCFVCEDDDSDDELVCRMVNYMSDIVDKVYELALKKWHSTFSEIDLLLQKYQVNETITLNEHTSDDEHSDDDFDDDIDDVDNADYDYEPPSKSFIYAISKPSSYHAFQTGLQRDEWDVNYKT